MAEPMSSNEIEDVLSSIRRLVAQDLKPADRAKLAAVADATQKLVLAPENRVEDAEHASGGKFATIRRPSRRAAFPPVDTVLADVSEGEWALGEQAQIAAKADDEPVFDAQMSNAPELRRKDQFSPEQEHAMQSALQDQLAPGDDGGFEAGRFDADQDAAPPHYDRPIAGTTYAEVEGRDDFIALQPGYGADDAPPMDDDITIDPNARLADYDEVQSEAQDAKPWQDGEPEELPEASDISGMSDFVGLHGTIEPDTDWADAAEARVIAELAGEAVAENVVQQAKDSFREPNFKSAPQAAPEDLFDEDQLRAMVQTIFREEMAGPMGERITRNIRKLVRAEVGRMLAAQELE